MVLELEFGEIDTINPEFMRVDRSKFFFLNLNFSLYIGEMEG